MFRVFQKGLTYLNFDLFLNIDTISSLYLLSSRVLSYEYCVKRKPLTHKMLADRYLLKENKCVVFIFKTLFRRS